MKISPIIVAMLVAQSAVSEISIFRRSNVSSGGLLEGPPPEAAPTYTVRDPYRVFDGAVYKITGPNDGNGWVEFSGRVIAVTPDGVCMNGNFGGEAGQYFVSGFPFGAEGQMLGRDDRTMTICVARYSTNYSAYIFGAYRTLRKLDYGTIYVPKPLTPEQIAAAKKKAQSEKQTAIARALDANEASAAKGEAYGLMRMGERYRDGDGVDKDLVKARSYLTRAAAAGSPTAEDDLKRLDIIAPGTNNIAGTK